MLSVLRYKATVYLAIQLFKLQRSHRLLMSARHFFANRVVDTWNYLPDNIIDFNSLSAFKRTVKLIDFTIFLKCD